jgi:NAD(P)-dependent dehydrogenase (short-subunit alcohol dehydrogenase family)
MTGKTILITGGASGIGQASALAFARKCANVFIVDIDEKDATAVSEEITQTGGVAATYTAALENADKNIRVNCVCPGAIQTPWVKRVTKGLNDLHPMHRIGQPEEVANAVVWLCSDESSFITGHSLVIDGGRIAGEW